jgi:hypothetical protein
LSADVLNEITTAIGDVESSRFARPMTVSELVERSVRRGLEQDSPVALRVRRFARGGVR